MTLLLIAHLRGPVLLGLAIGWTIGGIIIQLYD